MVATSAGRMPRFGTKRIFCVPSPVAPERDSRRSLHVAAPPDPLDRLDRLDLPGAFGENGRMQDSADCTFGRPPNTPWSTFVAPTPFPIGRRGRRPCWSVFAPMRRASSTWVAATAGSWREVQRDPLLDQLLGHESFPPLPGFYPSPSSRRSGAFGMPAPPALAIFVGLEQRFDFIVTPQERDEQVRWRVRWPVLKDEA